MDNEHLFIMLDACIDMAKEQLCNSQNIDSFAMVLETDNAFRSIDVQEKDVSLRYETFLEVLKIEAEAESITAMALLSNVTIPEHFSPAVSSGIRIHVEERDFKAQNKISARLLYVPYQLYREKEDAPVQIHLHDPIPVGFPCEIFV